MTELGPGPALDGVRVLDLSRLLPGPFATRLLLDLGACVDKLEDPRGGDYLRLMPPLAEDGQAAAFHWLNAGKRSFVLDLKRPAGRDAFLRLLPRYDVLVESFRPGVLARLGLGPDVLERAHPGLIHCALTGYGQDGPRAQRAGHDLNYLALAGVLGVTGPVGAPPQVFGAQVADMAGALSATVAILGALLSRAKDGCGRFLDLSLCESATPFALFALASVLGGEPSVRGEGVLSGGIAAYGSYRTSDGGYVSLAALEPKFWMAFCGAAGLEPDMDALRPGDHQVAWRERLEILFASRTRREWARLGAEADCCLEPVLEGAELLEDAQHRARGLFVDQGSGRLPALRTFAGEPSLESPPTQGEHTREILLEAGFEPEELEALLS
ncbi:MAG: CoA transferase [Deltaproteobacteria bacterium]|nr:CoA transferase [Deltaproteobacteria bacterium]